MSYTDTNETRLFENSEVWGQLFVPGQSEQGKVNVTYGRDIAKPGDIITTSLLLVETEIRTGKHQQLISKLRDCFDCYIEGLNDENISVKDVAILKSNYQNAKKRLPWFALAIFKGRRSADNVIAIYGVVLDFDEIRDAEHFKDRVRDNIPLAHLVFISPSGMGVKVVFLFKEPMLVNEDNLAQVTADFKYVYSHLLSMVEDTLGVVGDKCTNDISRVCYLSWDSAPFKRNAYVDWREILSNRPIINHGTHETHEKITPERKDNIPLSYAEEFERARQVVSRLAQIKFSYKEFIKIGMSLYSGFGDSGKELWMLLLDNPNYNDSARGMEAHWRSFASVRSTTLASLYYIGGKYGIC